MDCCNRPPTLRRPSLSMNGCSVLRELLEATSCCSFKSLISFGVRNLLYHFHTASQSLVQFLCGEDGCLPVGLGLSAVMYEFSAVSNDSDESV